MMMFSRATGALGAALEYVMREDKTPLTKKDIRAGKSTLMADAALRYDQKLDGILSELKDVLTSKSSKTASKIYASILPQLEELKEEEFIWMTHARDIKTLHSQKMELERHEETLKARMEKSLLHIENLQKQERLELVTNWFLFLSPFLLGFLGLNSGVGAYLLSYWIAVAFRNYPELQRVLVFWAHSFSKWCGYHEAWCYFPQEEGRYLIIFSLGFNIVVSTMMNVSPHWVVSLAAMIGVIYSIHHSQKLAFKNKTWLAIMVIVYLMDGLPLLHRLVFFVLKTLVTAQFWVHTYSEMQQTISSFVGSWGGFFVALCPQKLRDYPQKLWDWFG
jgi:hypothetical protein